MNPSLLGCHYAMWISWIISRKKLQSLSDSQLHTERTEFDNRNKSIDSIDTYSAYNTHAYIHIYIQLVQIDTLRNGARRGKGKVAKRLF